jgi:hypothetical protein
MSAGGSTPNLEGMGGDGAADIRATDGDGIGAVPNCVRNAMEYCEY